MADDKDTPTLPAIISVREAYAQGLKRYFIGSTCKRGHTAERSVRTGLCVECTKNPNGPRVVYDVPYHVRNREARAAYDAAYYVRNCERIKAYKKASPDKRKAARANSEAKRRGADGKYTPADIRQILKSQKGKCAYCRIVIGDNYHIDHIVPLTKGGTNWPRNLQVTCGPCNLAKHARDPITHAQSLGLLL
jgi:5-methylcytosine-specific restriction endonuclease McrA